MLLLLKLLDCVPYLTLNEVATKKFVQSFFHRFNYANDVEDSYVVFTLGQQNAYYLFVKHSGVAANCFAVISRKETLEILVWCAVFT